MRHSPESAVDKSLKPAYNKQDLLPPSS